MSVFVVLLLLEKCHDTGRERVNMLGAAVILEVKELAY